MDMTTIIVTVISCIGGASGIVSLFTIRQKKDSFTIQNMTSVLNEIKKQHNDFKLEANNKIEELEKRLNTLDLKDQMQTRAINKGYRCKYLLTCGNINATCPITEEFEKEIVAIEKLTKK